MSGVVSPECAARRGIQVRFADELLLQLSADSKLRRGSTYIYRKMLREELEGGTPCWVTSGRGGSKDNEDGDAQCDQLALDGREVHPVPAVLLGHASLQADQGNLISVGRPSIVRWPAKTKFLRIQLVAKIARLCAHECRQLLEKWDRSCPPRASRIFIWVLCNSAAVVIVLCTAISVAAVNLLASVEQVHGLVI